MKTRMTRRIVTIDEVRDTLLEYDKNDGICALVDVEDMGFCRDGVTRYYKFYLDGEPVIYFKY